SIKKVPGQEHQIRLFRPDQFRQGVQQLPALTPPLPGLLRRQPRKGAVQVKVRPVNNFGHDIPPYPWGSLQTSTQPLAPENFSSSGRVNSMQLLLLPAAGSTVSKRSMDRSRYT